MSAGRRTVHYLVEELLEGQTLREMLNDGPLPPRRAVEVAVQIAQGLAAAHGKRVIHRDLKPENILVTGDGVVKLLDFGLAKLLEGPLSPEDAARDSTLVESTEAGTVLGTVSYMSPEQLRGQPVSAASDIFAFGCVLYEMLSGRRAFAAHSQADAISAILWSDPPPLPRARPEQKVPAPLEQIVTRCLEKTAGDRFSSAHDLALALRAVLSGSDAKSLALAPATVEPGRRLRRPLAVGAIAVGAIAVGALAGLVALWQWKEKAPTPLTAPGPKRVAVLPFENLGSPEDAYFADGMADEVRGKLASLSGMTVIARASCEQYEGTTKPPAQIAEELDAPYLLTARVRWEKHGGTSRIRVTPELVEVGGSAAPTTRWQDSFDADLEDVFHVQSQIAVRVALALEVALDAGERDQLAERPTANLAAYDAFLRGQQAFDSLLVGGSRQSIVEFERAVALDPSFALAWARLARARTVVWVNGVPSRALAEGAHEAATRAIGLAPDLADARLALGYVRFFIDRDIPGALEELERGLAEHPQSVDFLIVTGLAKAARGRWDEGLADLERAVSLDPRSVYAAWAVGRAQLYRRRYPDARAALDRALTLDPAYPMAVEDRTRLYIAEGDVAGARRFVAELSKSWEPTRLAFFLASDSLSWLLDREQQESLVRLTPSAFGDDAARWELILAEQYASRGDTKEVREHAGRAAAAYASRVAESPDAARLRAAHGLALAFLGRRAEALREGERAVALLPIARDAYVGPGIQLGLVRICILVGEHERALDLLEPLLTIPCYLSPALLAVDPRFAPLKGNPRFEELVKAKG